MRHHAASSYNTGCRCGECTEAHRVRCAAIRAELAARPREQVPHGKAGYVNWRCRCGICTAANTERSAAWRASHPRAAAP
jgi:hypothetical protein